MDKEKNVVHLSIYLVKETITRRDQIVKDGCNGPAEIAISGSGKGCLYWKAPNPDYPKWTSLFEHAMDIKQIGKTAGVSAAFVLRVEGRYFVLTFGQGGRFLIEDDVCEERFGLLVALNWTYPNLCVQGNIMLTHRSRYAEAQERCPNA